MADTIKQQLDEIEVQILSLQRQLRASMDRFQTLYNQVSGSDASAEQAAADALGYKTDAETAAGTCTEAVTTVQGMIEGFSGYVEYKIDKIVDPVAGNVPTMTADGSLQTSVLALTDLAVKHPAGAGYFAVYDAEGGLNASGFTPSNTMAKPAGAVTGNVATYGKAGAVVDSNVALTAFVRHDTAQALSAAAKAQACVNMGLAAPVCAIEPLATGIGNSSVRGTGGTWYSTGSLAGMRLQFRVLHQMVGSPTSCTFAFADRGVGSTLAVEYLASALASWAVTSSGGRILIDNVDVAAVYGVITIAYTRGGSPGNWTANLTANGIPLPKKTGLPNAPEGFSIGSTTNTAGGWVSYQPHLHSWT